MEGSGFGDGQGLHQGLRDVDLDHDGLGMEVNEGGRRVECSKLPGSRL
jgi:hypothetical protein